MNKTKLASKGYTLRVVSWENDADNYRTKDYTVDTLEEAKKINKICKELFCSCNNGEGGVGNSMENEELDRLVKFVEENPDLFPDGPKVENGDEIMDHFQNLAYNLMGGSEFYDFRVCESCVCFYSDKDIFLENIDL